MANNSTETTAELFSLASPLCRELEFTIETCTDEWAQSLADTTQPCGLASLVLSSSAEWQDATIQALLQAPIFQNAESLTIQGKTRPKLSPSHDLAKLEGFGDYLEQTLANNDPLELSERGLTDESLRWLAEHPAIQTRDEIDARFAGNPAITDQGLAWLAESPNLLCIRSLDLSQSQITNKGLAVLANSPYARNLRELNFTGTKVTWRGLMQLADSPRLRWLYELEPTFSFQEANLKPDDVIDLSRSRYLLMFEELNFSYNPDAFSTTRTTRADEVMASLAVSPYVKNIETLYLAGNAIRNSSIFEFAKAQHFGSLKILDLCRNQIGARGLQTLLSSRLLSEIVALFLDGCPIRQSGAKSLAQAKHLAHLQRLDLCEMPDSEIVIPTFLEHFQIDHLSFLFMDGNAHFPFSNLEQIKKRADHFKNLEILSLKNTEIKDFDILREILNTEILNNIQQYGFRSKQFERQEIEHEIMKIDQTQKENEHEQHIATENGTRKIINVNGVSFGVRWIPSGQFMMGSSDEDEDAHGDEPQREVSISHGFWMMETVVTQRQYAAVMGMNPSCFKISGPEAPVENINWHQATEFASRFSKLIGINQTITHQIGAPMYLDSPGWRLPTEAEWEYAARAVTTTPRYGDLDSIAWYEENSSRTHSVGKKKGIHGGYTICLATFESGRATGTMASLRR